MDLPKDLVETYLAAVDAQLPVELRTDVIAELRDTLLSKLEEKEASLGRAPSPAETAATLKAFGHPLVVANRYRKHQQLIGPEIYPFYVVTLQWVLGVVVFLQIVLVALGASSARDPIVLLARAWSGIMPGVLGAFAIVTIVFLVIERAGGAAGLVQSWSPRSLSASRLSRPGQVWETLFEMAFEAVFLLLWTGVIRLPTGPLGHEDLLFAPAAIWTTLHTPIALVVAASLAVNALRLLRPGRLWTIAAGRVAVAAASLIIIVLLIRSDGLLVAGATDSAQLLTSWLNGVLKLGLAIAAAVWVFEGFAAVRHARRGVAPA